MTSIRSYGTDIKDSDTFSTLGFGDLCRYFYRTLKTDHEDYVAHNVCDEIVLDIPYISFLLVGWEYGRVLEKEQVPIL